MYSETYEQGDWEDDPEGEDGNPDQFRHPVEVEGDTVSLFCSLGGHASPQDAIRNAVDDYRFVKNGTEISFTQVKYLPRTKEKAATIEFTFDAKPKPNPFPYSLSRQEEQRPDPAEAVKTFLAQHDLSPDDPNAYRFASAMAKSLRQKLAEWEGIVSGLQHKIDPETANGFPFLQLD